MANSHVLISSQTLASTATSVTLGSLPGTYRDLEIVISGATTAQTSVFMQMNADTTAANYFLVVARESSGSGSSFSSNGSQQGPAMGTTPGIATIRVFDYAQTDKHKTMLIRYGSTNYQDAEMSANRWASTAAITSIILTASATSFAVGTTFNVYGIAG